MRRCDNKYYSLEIKIISYFQNLDISPQLLRSIEKMGFESPTPVQEAAIDPMLQGADLMVQAPTGTGKTCAFGIPLIEQADPANRQVQALVLCPTRELAIQTANVLKALAAYKPGIRIQAVYGGEPINRQIAGLRRKPQIIVATPGRLLDHMKRRTIRLGHTNLVVLDEADRMLDMGFRDDIDAILQAVPQERQTVLFSATLSKEVKRIASCYQKDIQHIQIQQDTLTVDRVEQHYSVVPHREKTAALLELLKEGTFAFSLIFVATKSMADTLSDYLNRQGFRADALHGDMRQSQRDAVMDRYRKRKITILVATDVAARGIDVQKIDAVINYDIPGDADSYVHRIGRTGRASQTGVAYTLVTTREYGKLQGIMQATGATITKHPLQVSQAAPQFDRRAGNNHKRAANHWNNSRSKHRKQARPAKIGA